MIVGAGPVGLTLAAGLAKQDIRSVVLEKKPELDEHSRALTVQASRTV
jgi:2-polyprenyl-6-methoxyphenol hydroxylase-like FAD-dependent oxidoreductase